MCECECVECECGVWSVCGVCGGLPVASLSKSSLAVVVNLSCPYTHTQRRDACSESALSIHIHPCMVKYHFESFHSLLVSQFHLLELNLQTTCGDNTHHQNTIPVHTLRDLFSFIRPPSLSWWSLCSSVTATLPSLFSSVMLFWCSYNKCFTFCLYT